MDLGTTDENVKTVLVALSADMDLDLDGVMIDFFCGQAYRFGGNTLVL